MSLPYRDLEDPTTRNRLFAEALKSAPSNANLYKGPPIKREGEGDSGEDEEVSHVSDTPIPDADEDDESDEFYSESDDEMADLLFNGKDSSALPEFIRVAEATFKLHDKFDGNEERKAAFIISKIRSPASIWLEQAIEGDASVETDYETLKAAMKARYEPSASEAMHRARDLIAGIQQKGTVEAYDTYFEATWARSGLSDDNEKARRFLQGLYSKTRQYIRQREDYTATRNKDWIKSKAQQFEDAQEPRTPRRNYASALDGYGRQAATPSTGRRNRQTDPCFTCGLIGHWSAECPGVFPPNPPQQAASQSRASTRASSQRARTPFTPASSFGDRPW